MSAEPELDILRAAWCESPAAAEFGRSGARNRSRLRLRFTVQMAFAAALIVFAAVYLRANFSTETLVWAIVVWLTTTAATAFEVWNWRLLWKPSGESVLDYTEAYEKRCRAMLRAVAFGYRFLAVQLAISGPWLTVDYARGEFPVGRYLFAIGLLAALTAAFLFAFHASRRRALGELKRVEEFRRGLAAAGPNPGTI